jgi:toxin YoeB
VRKLEFDPAALDDLAYWVEHDRKKAIRVIDLVLDTQRDPFAGKGKPEPLKHELAGCWSRRIDQEHRLECGNGVGSHFDRPHLIFDHLIAHLIAFDPPLKPL